MNALMTWIVFTLSLLSGTIHAADEATVAADKAWRLADHDLNAAYQALLPALTEKDAATLKKAQTAWLAYRDAQASLKARLTSNGGSAYSMDYLANSAKLTIERTQQLKTLLKLAKVDP